MNICIVGTGYVGLVTAACLAEMGNEIVCVDNNPAVVAGLKEGVVHIFEPGLEPLVKRNLAEDYRRAYGTDPGPIIGVAVMTDTDNTGTQAVGEYAGIRIGCVG